MGNKDELDSVRDASATVLLLKLLEMVSSGIEETSKLGTEFKETAINAATQLKAISTLSTDPASRHKLVESCNNLQKHLTKYAHPMSELIKKDIAKIIQAINIAAGEHWGLFQQTILTESIEGMKKVNLIPHSTSISDTLTTAIKSLGKNIRKSEEEEK